MPTLFARLIGLFLRLCFYALVAPAALGVLLLGVLVVLWMLLRALLTGRKPMPWLIWQQYRAAARSAQSRWTRRAAPGTARPASHYGSTPDDEVVDVQARELPTGHLPPPR
jgi:hypothetical protein